MYYWVPTPPGKSWIFFLENSLEKHFVPGSPGKISLKIFFTGFNGKQAVYIETM